MATSRKQSAQDPVGTIKTRRLILQPLTQADAPGVYALRSNPEIFHWRKSVDTKSQSDTWLYALSPLSSVVSWNNEQSALSVLTLILPATKTSPPPSPI